MSHVATVQLEVKDLAALRLACTKLGLEFMEGQTTHKWYGRWVNDYNAANAAYRQGVKTKDYGKCLHAIRVKGNAGAYEVGVIDNPLKPGTYSLIYDNWAGGQGLEKVIGKEAMSLKQRYAAEVARKQALRAGFRVTETMNADGKIVLKARR